MRQADIDRSIRRSRDVGGGVMNPDDSSAETEHGPPDSSGAASGGNRSRDRNFRERWRASGLRYGGASPSTETAYEAPAHVIRTWSLLAWLGISIGLVLVTLDWYLASLGKERTGPSSA